MALTTRDVVISQTQHPPRRHWRLTYSASTLDYSYDLEVNQDPEGDTFTFYQFDMGDSVQLVSIEEFNERVQLVMEHEPEMDKDTAVDFIMRLGSYEQEPGRAWRVELPGQAEIRRQMEAIWHAFAITFTPAILF